MATGKEFEVIEVGTFAPERRVGTDHQAPGEVGYVAASIKTIGDATVGDTITDALHPAAGVAGRLSAGQADGVLRPVPH